METFEFTHSYHRFPEEVPNRLDVLYNDKVFDVLNDYEKRAKFPFKDLKEVVAFRKERRNPQLSPSEDFTYTDIGSIDVIFGEPLPSIMQGKDASSSRMRQVMRNGDVLLSTTRPFRNAICITPEYLDNQICSTGFSVLIPKDVNSKFLFLALRSEIGNLQLQKLCSGSGYPAINQEIDVPVIRIPCPTNIKKQEKIVEAIKPFETEAKTLKAKATKLQNEAVNYLLEQLQIEIPENPNYFFKSGAEKQTISFSISVDTIFDRIHYLYFHPKYKALEALKKNFKTVTLESICTKPITRGEQPYYDEKGSNIVLKTVDLKNRFIDYDNALKVKDEFFATQKTSIVNSGDILLASTGYVSMGKVDVYDREQPGMVDGHVSIISVNEQYDPYFVCFFLRSHIGQIQIEKEFTGSSGQVELQAKDINTFVLPSSESIPRKRQEEISNVIRTKIEKAIGLEQQATDKLTEAKKLFESLVLKNK